MNDVLAPASVDLTNCGREPIHIPGSILPHGAMLVLDAVSHNLQACVGLGEMLGRRPLPSATLEGFLGRERAHAVRQRGTPATLGEAEASLQRYASVAGRVTASGPKVRLQDRAFSVL